MDITYKAVIEADSEEEAEKQAMESVPNGINGFVCKGVDGIDVEELELDEDDE
jgi:hypothetical protein